MFTAKLVEIEESDAKMSRTSAIMSVVMFSLTILVAIIICVMNCIRKKFIKTGCIGFILLVTILSFCCVFIFGIIGFECLVGTGFESLWTSTVDINKTKFEHEYSCCGYKELTVLCGCTSDEEGDCELTCHDKVIHPFGIMFITSALGVFVTTVILIVILVMSISSVFCSKEKYVYTRL